MSLYEAHEHVFYAHDDPRWLVCDCGQYGVRSRTVHGQFTIRLIDPPQPLFRWPVQVDVTTRDLGCDLVADLVEDLTGCDEERLRPRQPQRA